MVPGSTVVEAMVVMVRVVVMAEMMEVTAGLRVMHPWGRPEGCLEEKCRPDRQSSVELPIKEGWEPFTDLQKTFTNPHSHTQSSRSKTQERKPQTASDSL